jgi:hypothetical protein
MQLAVVAKVGTCPIALDVRLEQGGEYAPSSIVTRIRAPYVARDAFSFSVKRVKAKLSDGAVLHGMARLAGRHKVDPGIWFDHDIITANDTAQVRHCSRIPDCDLIQSQPHSTSRSHARLAAVKRAASLPCCATKRRASSRTWRASGPVRAVPGVLDGWARLGASPRTDPETRLPSKGLRTEAAVRVVSPRGSCASLSAGNMSWAVRPREPARRQGTHFPVVSQGGEHG